MKIGILTFHNCSNYGAAFQTYALHTAIVKNISHSCEVINYSNDYISSDVEISKMKVIRSIKDFIRYCILYKAYKKKNDVFKKFINDSVVLSENEYKKDNIKESNSIYDVFITGSDQVFNLLLTHNDTSYFLDFVHQEKKRISYAASVGNTELIDMNADIYVENLSKFNNISVREEQTKNKLMLYGNFNISVVMDPTFLLSKDEWESIGNDIVVSEKYILLYLISPEKYNFEFARKLSKITGYTIYYINYKPFKEKGMKNLWAVTPEQFITLLKKAEYVVTNSFHGTALSINMNKNFFYELSQKKSNGNSRIEQLIGFFGLESRQIVAGNNDYINENINYDKINYILDDLKNESLNFLSKALS